MPLILDGSRKQKKEKRPGKGDSMDEQSVLSEVFIFGFICIVLTAIFMSIISDFLGKIKPKQPKKPPPMMPMMPPMTPNYPMQPQPPIPMYQQQGLDPNVAALLQYMIMKDSQ